MPRQRPRLDERMLFAILLIEFGLVLPLLSAFSSPGAVPIAGRPENPRSSALAPTLPERMAMLDGSPSPIAGGSGTNDQRLAPVARSLVADPGQPIADLNAPTATLPALPAEAAGAAQPTLTNTPEPLAAVLGPVDAAAPRVPTLFPTLVGTGDSGTGQAPPDVPGGPPPPILMYHYIRNVDQASDPLGYELSVAPELFEAHMAWLHERSYRTMRMGAVARCLANAMCPSNAVALTFDDGYEDAFTTVLPVLRRYGFTATFYIVSGFVGQPGYMSWEQLAALRDAGMEIGAHTIDHLDLTSLDPTESERQIVQSKADLEQRLGISIVSFCYPTGLHNWTIEDQTRAAGYLSATTTRWDDDYSDVMALPRRRVSGGAGVEAFAAMLP